MDISKLTGLGILGYLLLTSKMKVELGPSYKDLEDKTKDLEDKNEDLEEKLKETYEELDQYTEKKSDLVFKPELHIDINGGCAMSSLYLTIKNNSAKLSYKIGDISARSILALAYTANTFEPKKNQTITIKPGRSYRLLLWSRNTLKGQFLSYKFDPENLVFLPPQSDYFNEDVWNELNNFPGTFKTHMSDSYNFIPSNIAQARTICYEFPSGLLIKQLNATVYTSNDEKQEIIFNDIEGSLLVYTVENKDGIFQIFPNYKSLRDGYGWDDGHILYYTSQYIKKYYNPETKLWESTGKEWIGENTHVFK